LVPVSRVSKEEKACKQEPYLEDASEPVQILTGVEESQRSIALACKPLRTSASVEQSHASANLANKSKQELRSCLQGPIPSAGEPMSGDDRTVTEKTSVAAT